MQNSRLVDDVVRQLETSILSGEIGPGERLLVVPITQQFGIAQTTAREALLMLERRGLVTTKPRRGSFVTRLSGDEAFELCQARALVEGFAVARGVHELSDAKITELRNLVDVMGGCKFPRDLPLLIQTDIAFHQIIAGLCQSRLMIELWSTLNGKLGALIMSSLERKQLNTADVVRYHSDAVDALATRDVPVAMREICAHYMRDFPNERLATKAVLESALLLSGD